MLAGIAAVFGHIFPVWLKFKGGKGVATFIGVMLGLLWPEGLMVIGTWLVVALLFRISSLSALVAAALAPVYTMLSGGNLTYALFTLILTVIIVFTHHDNIYRLWHGQEPRIDLHKGGTR